MIHGRIEAELSSAGRAGGRARDLLPRSIKARHVRRCSPPASQVFLDLSASISLPRLTILGFGWFAGSVGESLEQHGGPTGSWVGSLYGG